MKKASTKTTTIKRLADYYYLTKPGIVRGNVIAAAAGFLLASYGDVDYSLMLATLSGVALVIASACVFNNVLDRKIDSRMARTKTRALARGAISVKSALIFATLLSLFGFLILALETNLLTVVLGFVAIFVYVVLYGVSKRRSIHGTVIGSISGAMPLVAGYTAVTNDFDYEALLLFLIMVFWQMPHFYSIAIYRLKEYRSAGLPVLPIKNGIRHTKFQILVYIVAFIAAVTMLSASGYTGKTYLAVMAVVGFFWLWQAIKGFYTKSNERWARKTFAYSLSVLLIFSVLISFDNFLP